MHWRILITLIVLRTCYGYENIYHVNSTDDVCLSGNLKCLKDTFCSCLVNLNNKDIIKNVYLNGKLWSSVIDDQFKNRSTILFPEFNFSLCLFNTSTTDAGKYIVEIDQTHSESYILFVHEKPSVPRLSVLNNGIVDYHPAEIQCNSSSNTVPSVDILYSWTVNGSLIDPNEEKYSFQGENTSVLFINVEREDSDNNYSCGATEMYGQTAYSDLGVQIKPESPALVEINRNISLIRIVEYESLTLRCETRGAVPHVTTYTWYRDNQIQIDEKNFTYSLDNITREHTGTYNCTAFNTLPINGSDDIYIDVLFGPEIQTMPLVKQEIGFGVNITCNVKSNPKIEDENVTWTKKNNSSSFFQMGKSLYIPQIRREDHGDFQCEANLTLKSTNGNEVIKSDKELVYLDVLYGPSVFLIDQQNPEEDDNVNITCEVDSNPPASVENITWYFQNNSTKPLKKGAYFQMQNIKRNQSGLYICEVNVTLSPTVGSKVVRSSFNSTNVDVLYQPFIETVYSSTVSENGMVNLSCSVNANPLAKVHWIYGPKNLTLLETSYITHSNNEATSILTFSNATCNETGNYVCVADNLIKEVVKGDSSLIVKCSPRLENQDVLQQNFTVMKNESLNFTEWFYAYPKPSFHLISSNSTISNVGHDFELLNVTDNRFQYRTGIEIQKENFEASDIGKYVLIASNNIGSFNISYNIMYTRKPDAPILQPINCKDNYGTAVVYWNGGWNGGLKQHFEILYRLTKHEEFILGSKTPIQEKNNNEYSDQLYNLLPNQEYVFKIRASNQLDFEESAEVNCTTKGKEEVSGNTSAVIGAAAGSVLGFVVIIVIVVVMIIRRKRNNRKDKEMELLRTRTDDNVHDDNEEGLKDNICYVSADELKNVAKPSTEYAVVNKKTQKTKETLGNETNVKGKQKSDVYEDINKEPKSSNVKRIEGKRNKDGLVYVDIVFDKTPNKKKFVIIGEENRTNYSQIDFSKTAEPLPDDDEDEEGTAETNNDKTGEY